MGLRVEVVEDGGEDGGGEETQEEWKEEQQGGRDVVGRPSQLLSQGAASRLVLQGGGERERPEH